eukprot:CAMPEP_0197424198 /NCGR_PEP_ID=MMETSP1170-20131217/25196_1 /TAXON_ID=54406 /ORGANISM="Sarcinochrysis sp, Strain CCMP770" /LENGTH=252 /DNA_ID=CAMNT_0042951673 /DNA_START=40 /DNA_END=798 /DNA_ORIENTATION=+
MIGKIAVLYGTRGGMGDVGKFVASQAWAKSPELAVNVAALSWAPKEGGGLGFDKGYPDVTYEGGRAELEAAFEGKHVEAIDAAAEDAVDRLRTVVEGCDAVVACLGNREPFMPRWVARGTETAVDACRAAKVPRLVVLNSFGIADESVLRQNETIPRIWRVLLATLLRRARTDLRQQATFLADSCDDLDVLVVKPAGLSPEKAPTRTWKVATPDDNAIDYAVAKSDVATFMLDEALHPTMHATAVTIGGAIA